LYVFNHNRVHPELAEIMMPGKVATKTLAVWRFLNVEVDYMKEIKDGSLDGTIVSVEPNQPAPGQSILRLGFNIASELQARAITNISENVASGPGQITGNGIVDYFQDGKISVSLPGGAGINNLNMTYDVLHNSSEPTGHDHIIIRGVIPVEAAGQRFTVRPDDESMGFTPGTRLQDAIAGRVNVTASGKCWVENRYERAYIIPDFNSVNTPAMNAEPHTPFVRNTKKYENDDQALFENYRFDNIALQQNEDFWVVYLLFAFKGCTYEDGDPDGGGRLNPIDNTVTEPVICGITDKQRKGAHIFLEDILEFNGGIYLASPGNGRGELDAITHELAHLLGATHDDLSLLAFPDPLEHHFSPKSLGTLRDAKRPGICCQQ
jgi:hypothetical protein